MFSIGSKDNALSPVAFTTKVTFFPIEYSPVSVISNIAWAAFSPEGQEGEQSPRSPVFKVYVLLSLMLKFFPNFVCLSLFQKGVNATAVIFTGTVFIVGTFGATGLKLTGVGVCGVVACFAGIVIAPFCTCLGVIPAFTSNPTIGSFTTFVLAIP